MTDPKTYAHTLESCPSKHWNGGNDVCEDCGADLNLTLGAPDALAEPEAFAYPSPGDEVTTADGVAVVDSLDTSRGADFAPEVYLAVEGEPLRATEAAFLIRTGPSSWRERLPRAGTVGGTAPAQVLEVGDVFHGAPLPELPPEMRWDQECSDLPGGHALIVIGEGEARPEGWLLDVAFSDRAQGDALRPIIMEAAQRIMMQPAEALDETPGAESYALRFPLDHKATATRAYSDGFADGGADIGLRDLLDDREINTILGSLRATQAVQQHEALDPEIIELMTEGGTVTLMDDGEVDELCERINCDTPRAGPVPSATVYMVQAEHWSVPGQVMKACATEEIAAAQALELLNSMREELDLPAATDLEQGLAELKKAVDEAYGNAEELDIWITAVPLTA